MASISFNKNFNIGRVVRRIVYTVLALYVGGTIISTFGEVMNNTASPFYSGLTLIGWTTTTVTDALSAQDCSAGSGTVTVNNCINNVDGAGVLAVIGVIGIAGIVMEFISF